MENQRIISTDKGSTTTATKRTIESAEQLTPTSPEMSMVKTKKSAIEEAAARLRLPLSSNNSNKKFKKTQQQLNQPGNNEDDEEEVDESQLRCEKIQSDIDLARKDQQSDYDQFRNQYSSLHDDLRYLQREIEEFESNCLNGNHKLNNNEECFGYQSEPTSVVTGSLMAAVSMSDDNDDDSDSEGEGDKNIIRNKICKTVKIKTGPRHIISTPSAATAAP
ncbi:15692_t:CDS:2 [Entrophospora sp. SA101]|nr:15692_t:CDS:2 [Entrophospora sp. SA101]